VIGDSHIGLADGSEQPIVAWLDRLEALAPRALYLNGDLFHYLIADDKFCTRSVQLVFERLRALRDAGVPVHYVEGNRDFFLEGSFAEEAVTDVAMEYAVRAGARNYLIVHGDMINDRDWPYRFWRFASKNAVSRLALKFIPRRTARNFVDSDGDHLCVPVGRSLDLRLASAMRWSSAARSAAAALRWPTLGRQAVV